MEHPLRWRQANNFSSSLLLCTAESGNTHRSGREKKASHNKVRQTVPELRGRDSLLSEEPGLLRRLAGLRGKRLDILAPE